MCLKCWTSHPIWFVMEWQVTRRWHSVAAVSVGVNGHWSARSGKREQKPLCLHRLLGIWFRQNTDSKTHSAVRAKANHLIWRMLYIHLTFKWKFEMSVRGSTGRESYSLRWSYLLTYLLASSHSFYSLICSVFFSHNPLSALWRFLNSIYVILHWPYSHLTSIEDSSTGAGPDFIVLYTWLDSLNMVMILRTVNTYGIHIPHFFVVVAW